LASTETSSSPNHNVWPPRVNDAFGMIPAFFPALVALVRSMTVPTSRRRDDERGQGLVEYALVLVLIAIFVIVVVGVVGHQTNNVFSNVSNGLNA
jgi:pilus assembly protein Flp/PilA